MKISELPTKDFNSSEINELVFIQNQNTPEMYRVEMAKIFNWIKEQALSNGLTVELTGNNIMFIKGTK